MLRLVIPTLFEPHMLQALHQEGLDKSQLLEASLARGDLSDTEISDLYSAEFNLDSSHLEYVPWISDVPGGNVLRADPVILEPTHNGILCRGNEILHLAQDEREEIETLFNDHFKDDGLRLTLDSPSTGLLEIGQQQPAEFSTLQQVLGQDISHYLPRGEAGGYWQQVLMETQMLLHRAECNTLRREQGEKTVDSLWFWGRLDAPSSLTLSENTRLYSNHPVVQKAFAIPANQCSIPTFDEVLAIQGDVTIHSWQLEQSVVQFDTTTWEQAYIRCLDELILPAVKAVSESRLKAVEIIAEHRQYTVKSWHRLRFWR